MFLKCDIDSYLDICWNKLKINPTDKNPELKVIIHLCSAHLLHGIGFYINKKYKLKKDMKKLFLHSIGFMVRTTDLALINIVFSALCMVFKSSHLSETVIGNIKILESYISGSSVEFLDNSEDNNEEDITNDNLDVVKAGNLMKDRSPFGKHFINISQQCDINVSSQHNTGEANPYYYPDLIGYLLTYYLPILPLWSGIILGPHRMSVDGKKYSHYSNAIAENWMRIVKIDILNSKCNLRPGDFIRTIYPAINSRISAFKFGLHPRAGKIFKYGKRKRELEEQCVEEWSRKKKKYGGYLKPTTFEVPKPSSKSKPVKKSKSNISVIYNPQVLHT